MNTHEGPKNIMELRTMGVQRGDLPVEPQASAPMSRKKLEVVSLTPIELFGLSVVEKGVRKNTVAYRIAGKWWLDPNGETWVRKLYDAPTVLIPQLDKLYETQLAEAKQEPVPDDEIQLPPPREGV